MTCFLVDDQLLSNPKIQEAINLYGGPGVVALWTCVGLTCSGPNTEGVIGPATPATVGRILIMQQQEIESAVDVLVKTKLWHTSRSVAKCEACREHLASHDLKLKPGQFLFHDWGQQQFSRQEAKDPVARSKRNRRRQLHRMPDLVRAIRERDGEFCRYCACKVNFKARTGPSMGTYDHIDPECFEPNGGNFLDGVVVACGHCNGEKGERTPEQWHADGGLLLLPVPDRGVRNACPPVRTSPPDGQDVPDPDLALTGAHARVGPGQDGPGPGQAPRSEQARSGPGPGLTPLRPVPPLEDDHEPGDVA